ncbi:MAG: carboxylesterase family protein [Polyangiales bacterium]
MLEGRFVGSAVAGLRYTTDTESGTTDAEGRFRYRAGEQVAFAVGTLPLGATRGRDVITPRDLIPDARDASDPAVANRLVLLQTLDDDGDLNTGIAISAETARIVGTYAARLDLAQATAAFAADPAVAALLTDLNASGVFTDVDPRPRALRSERAAREHFARAASPRKVVTTVQGALSGYAANESTWQWLGVRYAAPPLGALRWKPPAALARFEGVRDAVAWGDQAPQNPRFESNGEGGMSEDCLHLNVTAPANARDLPVMVWFHGGAFTILTSNSKAYNNVDGPSARGVVLVTVNHRLGPFGYLAHPGLAADSSYGGSGNYGQMDLVAALQWVKENIAGFGGNPDNVTIFGQSGGCGKVASLMNSPQAVGLFHKAACQSGTNAIPQTTANSVIAGAEQIGTAMFGRLGVRTVAEARALPWTAIVQSDIDAQIPREIYRPSIDGYYVSKTYYDTIRDGLPSDVPLLIGSTSGDYPSLKAGITEVMPFRAAHAKAPLYLYKFSRVPAGWTKLGLLSGHGGELPYLFNYPPMYASNYLLDLVLDPATGKRPEIGDLDRDGVTGTTGDLDDVYASMGWDEEDGRVADTLLTVWTHFAKTGNPSTPTLAFPAYTPASDQYVEFGQTRTEVKAGLATAFP